MLSLAACGSSSERSRPFRQDNIVRFRFIVGSLARACNAAWFPFPVEAISSGSAVVEYIFHIAPVVWCSFQLLLKKKL